MEKLIPVLLKDSAQMTQQEIQLSSATVFDGQYWKNIYNHVQQGKPLNLLLDAVSLCVSFSAYGLIYHGVKKVINTVQKETYKPSNTFTLNIDDLRQEKSIYRNCLHEAWQTGLYYIHPLKSNFLIRAERFNSFILDEQLNDIVSFIREYMSLSEFEVGILKAEENSFDAEARVNIKGIDVGVGGGFSKQFSGNYHLIYRDVPQIKNKTEHPWIHHFPEFSSVADAVTSGIGSMEKTVEIENSYSVNGKLLILGNGGSISNGKNCGTRFYISYTKA